LLKYLLYSADEIIRAIIKEIFENDENNPKLAIKADESMIL